MLTHFNCLVMNTNQEWRYSLLDNFRSGQRPAKGGSALMVPRLLLEGPSAHTVLRWSRCRDGPLQRYPCPCQRLCKHNYKYSRSIHSPKQWVPEILTLGGKVSRSVKVPTQLQSRVYSQHSVWAQG